MTIKYKMRREVYENVRALGFSPQDLPHETLTECDLCGNSAFQVIAWLDRYGFDQRSVMCESCGLVFLNPRPTSDGYATFYKRYYRSLIAAYKNIKHSPDMILPEQRMFADHLVRLFKTSGLLQPGLRAVDLGGSTGVVAQALREEEIECLVVDPAPDELALAEAEGFKTELGPAENWMAPPASFDIVLICRTVDHFQSIRKVLENAHSFLKPGGLLFVDIVDFETIARCRDDYRIALKIDHCFYLSDKTVRAYFTSTGYDVVTSDITTGGSLNYVCRRIDDKVPVHGLETHAEEMSALFRQKLIATPPQWPVDLLTRIWRRSQRFAKKADEWVYL